MPCGTTAHLENNFWASIVCFLHYGILMNIRLRWGTTEITFDSSGVVYDKLVQKNFHNFPCAAEMLLIITTRDGSMPTSSQTSCQQQWEHKSTDTNPNYADLSIDCVWCPDFHQDITAWSDMHSGHDSRNTIPQKCKAIHV